MTNSDLFSKPPILGGMERRDLETYALTRNTAKARHDSFFLRQIHGENLYGE